MHKDLEKLEKLRTLSRLLDSKFKGPFGIHYGLDALLGLIPVVGDFSTSLASLYIITEAANLGCSLSLIFRMLLNVILENIVGVIPFLGNVFDFYWKANNKNVALLEAHLRNPRKTAIRSGIIVFFIFFVILTTFLATAYGTFLVLEMIVMWISQL